MDYRLFIYNHAYFPHPIHNGLKIPRQLKNDNDGNCNFIERVWLKKYNIYYKNSLHKLRFLFFWIEWFRIEITFCYIVVVRSNQIKSWTFGHSALNMIYMTRYCWTGFSLFRPLHHKPWWLMAIYYLHVNYDGSTFFACE